MFSILKKQAFGVTNRLLKRDFSGNTGIALKNSILSFLTSSISKAGSIIFVYLVMMRYLSQDVFGLYSLTLSTILLFSGFADIGIGTALINFVSKKREKSRGHIFYLFRIRLFLTSVVCFLLLGIGFLLSEYFYKQPIFLGIVAGVFYIFSTNVLGFFMGIYPAENNFKVPLFKELIFQVSRIGLVLVAILLTVSMNPSAVIFWIILALSVSMTFSGVVFFPSLRKYGGGLKEGDKNRIKKYVLPLSATVLSGLFFGYIDTLMLGRYVLPEFIAYYQAAFSLITSASAFVSFSGVLFPIFSRISKVRLEVALKKAIVITGLLGVAAAGFTILISHPLMQVIGFVTGRDYMNSLGILRILALILLTDPLISVLSAYFYSIEKPKKVARAVVISTIANILFNLVLINSLSSFGMISIVLGVSIATVISRFLYVGILFYQLKKENY